MSDEVIDDYQVGFHKGVLQLYAHMYLRVLMTIIG